MGRAPCCEKVGLNKGRWTAAEDELLLSYIKAHGEGAWRSLPKNAGLLRCGKSCRLRWINYLREDLRRGNITEEEEETIIKLQASLGNKWSRIAAALPGRTDNEIKNHWNAHLIKKTKPATSKTGAIAVNGRKRRRTDGNKSASSHRRKKKGIAAASADAKEEADEATTEEPSAVVEEQIAKIAVADRDKKLIAVHSELTEEEGGPLSSENAGDRTGWTMSKDNSSPGNNGGMEEGPELDWEELENISLEEVGEMWQWLWEGDDDNPETPQAEATNSSTDEDFIENNLERWLPCDSL